jgi:hypothetical protein
MSTAKAPILVCDRAAFNVIDRCLTEGLPCQPVTDADVPEAARQWSMGGYTRSELGLFRSMYWERHDLLIMEARHAHDALSIATRLGGRVLNPVGCMPMRVEDLAGAAIIDGLQRLVSAAAG